MTGIPPVGSTWEDSMVLLLAAWLLGIQGGTGQSATVLPAPAMVLQVTMPSGSVNRLTIPAGKHGSVGSVAGPTLDLSPTLKEDGSLEITVTPVGWDPATGSLVSGTAERQVVQPGETANFATAPFPIAVKWLGTVATGAPTGSSAGDAGAERCCLICDSVVFCACAVVTPCGDCCAESCGCQGGGTSLTQRGRSQAAPLPR
jgi:hypothetical protein